MYVQSSRADHRGAQAKAGRSKRCDLALQNGVKGPMGFTFTVVSALILASSIPEIEQGIAMIALEGCRIEFNGEAINKGKWGGRIALYDVSVATVGTVTAIKRRPIEKSEHLVRWVRVEQLDGCVQRWRFERGGEYTVSLLGGTIYGQDWIVVVQGNGGHLRLRIPVHRRAR